MPDYDTLVPCGLRIEALRYSIVGCKNRAGLSLQMGVTVSHVIPQSSRFVNTYLTPVDRLAAYQAALVEG